MAHSLGLVSKICSKENIDLIVNNWLKVVTDNSPRAIQYGLEAFDKISSSESNHEYLLKMLELVLNSDDAKEGVSAFKEKRNPNWK
jgi:1,4-dihydroxy-2-naphthoyl-CoA synthase